MVFSSLLFLFGFLPVFLLLYFLAGRRCKNTVIIAASAFFYAWGAPRFLFVVLGTTLLDFIVVRAMAARTRDWERRALLVVSLSVNLGLLFYFKYSHFFIENVNRVIGEMGGRPIPWLKLALPIGISFYTFETITYVVDVYRNVHRPLRSFGHYLTYILLFPKLIAGPIIRYHDIADQLYDRSAFETTEHRLRGLYRFFIGLGKKVLIANVVGAQADAIFGLPVQSLSTGAAWLGALSYTFQIYFDFSGYSDMAIGLGQTMGFRFPENFNNPYAASSVTDFWRRWHISLGAWMRNYLYIPLGGNRVSSKARIYLNLWLVFLASGLWHGAAWGFVFWGAYHGFFLVMERAWLSRFLARIGRLSVLYTFVVVLTGWVFFRLEHLGAAIAYLGRMLGLGGSRGVPAPAPGVDYLFVMGIAILCSFFILLPGGRRLQAAVFFNRYSTSGHIVLSVASAILLAVCAARITTASFNPFIYFRF